MNTSPSSEQAALEQRNRELSILNAIAQALNRETELRQALHTTLRQIVDLFHLHTGWIWLMDEATGAFSLAASLNLPPGLAESPERMAGWCYCQESFRSGSLASAANVSIILCTRLKNLLHGTDGLRNHASVPLSAHGKRLGILNVVGRDWRELSPDDLRLLYTVGDLLSIAIERARLFANSARLGALEERNRLAREIHDTLAQGLAATALQLETAEALLDAQADPERLRPVVQRALQLTRKNLEEARRSVLDLRAAPLEGKTLLDALRGLAAEAESASAGRLHVEVVVEGETPLPALPTRIEIGLYRIVQEALANVARHAAASEAQIRLSVDGGRLDLVIADDGVGFDPASVPAGRFGLIGIRERAHLIGGSVSVCSAPGSGVQLEISVPLHEEPRP
ncbi:MAG: GAF domain-containing sensor histidine kinase [Anaerolineae bacterium]|nr:GAF domain-containing sensor histidine kinase [Anaerolineae bacterium]